MTQYSSPNSDITVNTWTPSTGSTLYGCIDEPFASFDITDYISTTGTNITCEVGLSALTDPLTGSGHTINVRAKRTSSGAACTAYLFEGTTQRAAFSVTVGANWATTTYTLAAGEANNITNYTNLRLRFVGTKAMIACADFEVPDPPALTTSTPADSASVLTAILVTLVSLVTPVQTVSVTDSVNMALSISVSESASVHDDLPSLYESVAITDQVNAFVVVDLNVNATEPVTVADVTDELLGPTETIAGYAEVSEQVSVTDALQQIYDSVVTVDSATVAVAGEQLPPLSLGVAETVEVNEYYPGWRENVTVSEDASGNVEIIWLVQVAEDLSIVTEEVAVTVPEPVTLEIAVEDSCGVADESTASGGLFEVQGSEGVSVSEEVTVTVPTPVTLEVVVEDSCGVAEETTAYEDYLAEVIDSAAVLDETAVNVPVPVDINVSASQAATVAESVTPMMVGLVIDVSQSATVVDTTSASSSQSTLTINVANAVNVVGSAEGTFDILLSISENVSITDVPNASCLAQPLLIFTTDETSEAVDVIDIPILVTSLAIDVTDDAGITAEAFNLEVTETYYIPPLLGTIGDAAEVAESVLVAINPSSYTLVYLMRMS